MEHRIPLTRGQFAVVSAEDFEKVSALKWRAQPKAASVGGFYAVRTIGSRKEGPRHTLYMHRFIMGVEGAQVVDHANGDGLDNRRANLRITSLSGNNANRDNYVPTSGFRGVYPAKGGLWRARLWVKGKSVPGGYHRSAEEAARAYDMLAIQYFGEMATLNFPQLERSAA